MKKLEHVVSSNGDMGVVIPIKSTRRDYINAKHKNLRIAAATDDYEDIIYSNRREDLRVP